MALLIGWVLAGSSPLFAYLFRLVEGQSGCMSLAGMVCWVAWIMLLARQIWTRCYYLFIYLFVYFSVWACHCCWTISWCVLFFSSQYEGYCWMLNGRSWCRFFFMLSFDRLIKIGQMCSVILFLLSNIIIISYFYCFILDTYGL